MVSTFSSATSSNPLAQSLPVPKKTSWSPNTTGTTSSAARPSTSHSSTKAHTRKDSDEGASSPPSPMVHALSGAAARSRSNSANLHPGASLGVTRARSGSGSYCRPSGDTSTPKSPRHVRNASTSSDNAEINTGHPKTDDKEETEEIGQEEPTHEDFKHVEEHTNSGHDELSLSSKGAIEIPDADSTPSGDRSASSDKRDIESRTTDNTQAEQPDDSGSPKEPLNAEDPEEGNPESYLVPHEEEEKDYVEKDIESLKKDASRPRSASPKTKRGTGTPDTTRRDSEKSKTPEKATIEKVVEKWKATAAAKPKEKGTQAVEKAVAKWKANRKTRDASSTPTASSSVSHSPVLK